MFLYVRALIHHHLAMAYKCVPLKQLYPKLVQLLRKCIPQSQVWQAAMRKETA